MKTLSQLLSGIEYTAEYDKTVYPDGINGLFVPSVCNNSEKAEAGALFICLKGARADGHDFAGKAYLRGARIFICEHKIPLPDDAVLLIAESARRAQSFIVPEFFSHPEKKLKIIGITGTKGKSTVAYMTAHILNKSGRKAGIIGTCGIVIGENTEPTENTTPEFLGFFRALGKMADAGCEYAVAEISSQALMLGRVDGIRFFAAAMTNLSSDHIGVGEHPDFESYKSCKKLLFSRCDTAVFNSGDRYFEEFSACASCPYLTYSLYAGADFSSDEIIPCKNVPGVSFRILCREGNYRVSLPLPGGFSVCDALAATALCSLAGVSVKTAAAALSDVSVPGRFEIVSTPLENVMFIIDYAHNGESLRAALGALREYNPKRLICLFGSVGCRTQIRRKELGLAAENADFCILTSDNPDTEPPENIIGGIAENLGDTPYVSFTDRTEAIKYAVKIAQPGDIVLFAGKGHERFQLVNGKRIPMCERELIEKYAFARAGNRLPAGN